MRSAPQTERKQGQDDGSMDTVVAGSISQAKSDGNSASEAWTNRLLNRIARQSVMLRVLLLAATHFAIFSVVYWTAFALRFDFALPPETVVVFWLSLPWILAVKLPVFFFSGHYHGWWSFVTFDDLVALIRAASLSLLIIVVIDHFIILTYQIPRVVLALDFILGIVVLGAIRASWRRLREQLRPGLSLRKVRSALLVGADHSSAILAYQIQSHFQLPYQVAGFLATKGERKGTRLGQIPVLGDWKDIREIATASRAQDILMTAGKLPGPETRELMEACDELGLQLRIIPPEADRFRGDHRIPIRAIEISDLLKRDPVKLDLENIGKLLEGRTVMVTGAGGSIGGEICRQVMKFNPQLLLLVGNGENPIFKIERELQTQHPASRMKACIGCITDAERMRQILQEHRPNVVFHAAAHKHVPLMETNVGQAVKNNVFGTKTLADLAGELGVSSFVFISTDKAVHPTSVMGVTKHVAERYVHAMSQQSSTRFTVVRFGNVLGSEGSVVPVFQEQIRRGGPITITDSRMTRFFMTIPEASQLVLQAASMGAGGEIFVLDMGQPVKIVDLARDLIRLSGLPAHAIEIVFTGIRPGEKLYEELYFDDEETMPTDHPELRAAYHRPESLSAVRRAISGLEELIHAPQEVILKKLHEIVPEFVSPSGDTTQTESRPPGRARSTRMVS